MEFIESIFNTLLSIVPVITAMYWQIGKLKSDQRADMAEFKNDVKGLISKESDEHTQDMKETISFHDTTLRTIFQEMEDISLTINTIEKQNKEQTDLLKLHEHNFGIYYSKKAYFAEVYETIFHSIEILKGTEKKMAGEYLYQVAVEANHLASRVIDNGFHSLTDSELDAFIANAINNCRVKFENIYGSDMWGTYYRKGLPVYNFKDEIKVLRNDCSNNTERRFRTLLMKGVENICCNFINFMYINN